MSYLRHLQTPSRHLDLHIRRQPLGLFLASATALVLAWTSRAQDLTEVLSGKAHPLAMKLKDFTTDWRRISIQNGAAANGNISVNVSGNSSSATSQNNLTGAMGGGRNYVTRGQTVSIGDRSYLVAYHLPAGGLDLATLLQAVISKSPPTAAVLSEESSLQLSLLELKNLATLDDIRPFDMSLEIRESENVAKMVANALKTESGKPASSPATPPKGEPSKPAPEPTTGR
jgi:hypothetical protein